MGVSKIGVGCLALGALAAAVLPQQFPPYDFSRFGPWQPDRFDFWCGTPYRDTHYSGNTANQVAADSLSRLSQRPAFYLDEGGQDQQGRGDLAAPGCENIGTGGDTQAAALWQAREAELEDMAQHALRHYRDMRSGGGNSFSPPPLGPIVDDETGTPAVRIYLDPRFDKIGQTVSWHFQPAGGQAPRWPPVEPWSHAYNQWNPDALLPMPPWFRYRSIAHELAHVVQRGQGAWVAKPAVYGFPRPWIGEGTADALSIAAMKARGHDPRPPLSMTGAQYVYGLRPYDRSLTWLNTEGISSQDTNRRLAPEYASSSFWAYVADRYFDGDLGYLIDWFAVPGKLQGQDEDDWLKWLDDRMDADAPWPLYLVFPDFIGNYAAWGHKEYTHIGEDRWLDRAFPKCQTVEVSPESGRRFNVDLEPISAACFRVRIKGLNPGEPFSVQWMVRQNDPDLLDNLHLTAARVPSTVGGETLECYDYTDPASPRYGGRFALCLDKPFTGSEGRQLEPSDLGGATVNASQWYVKTWNGVEQVERRPNSTLRDLALRDAQPLENLYFLSHVPLDPRDRRHDVQDNPFSEQSVRFEIRVDRAKMTRADDGSKPTTASVNGSAGLGMIPMQGGEGAQANGMEALRADILAAANMGSDPEALSQGLFLQNMSMGTLFPDVGPCDGVCTVMLDEKEERTDGFGGHTLETTRTVALSLEEGIPFGAGGTYKAHVTGCAGINCADGIIFGKGSVSVLEYNDDVLRLRATGSYCIINSIASLNDCRDPVPFDAEINKPFGWAYDRARTFTSIDTPGMAEYREYLMQALGDVMPNAVAGAGGAAAGSQGQAGGTTQGGGAGTGAGAQGGAVAQTCDCTCTGYRTVMNAMAAYQAAMRAGTQPDTSLVSPNTARRCAMRCATQWSSCGG